jgi:hypothetical protein
VTFRPVIVTKFPPAKPVQKDEVHVREKGGGYDTLLNLWLYTLNDCFHPKERRQLESSKEKGCCTQIDLLDLQTDRE